jgi:hypothetical protein
MFRNVPLGPVRRSDYGQCGTNDTLPIAHAAHQRVVKHYSLFADKPMCRFPCYFLIIIIRCFLKKLVEVL